MRSTVIALVIAALVVTGCSTSSGSSASAGLTPLPSTETAELTVDCATFESAGEAVVAQAITVSNDAAFDVALCTNPSTGFSWEPPVFDGDPIVTSTAQSTLTPVNAPPGSPGVELFSFLSNASGTTVIHFTYSQPWSGGTKGAWRLDLTVTVS